MATNEIVIMTGNSVSSTDYVTRTTTAHKISTRNWQRWLQKGLMELLQVESVRYGSLTLIDLLTLDGQRMQDRLCKDRSRAPITARLVANLLQVAGIHHVITMDLHASQERQEASVVSKMVLPDSLNSIMSALMLIMLKVLVGEVRGKMAILIDDMCDTAGTLCKAATTVKEHGAAEVLAICTHGILSGNAIGNLNACDALSKVVVTNTVPLQGKDHHCAKLVTINIAPTLSGITISISLPARVL
ncbi:MAG: hypothetical protein Q9217_000129 [Psora testacea]